MLLAAVAEGVSPHGHCRGQAVGALCVHSDTLLFDLTDHVAVITLNRSAVRNAMNRELSAALMEALQRVREDADMRVASIRSRLRRVSALCVDLRWHAFC